ncbi:GGDEF domain-containing protein [Halioxenophilus sp. WMMB6]|uniref:GGDEF domain-containing protein n=1 Tax=Halioxenophilus sp. WMMB6 TaxID=3073815 RepID=UPI00295F4484|nr:GGDEF domain-containing protein [Halioxenophilus sp. WMMB6]
MLSQTDARSRLGKGPALVTPKARVLDPNDTLGFVQSLQSSLELEVILPFLLDHIRISVPGCRLLYQHNELNINIELGGPSLKNKCFYQLKTDQDKLGEIRISNSTRFSENALQVIEQSLAYLLYPLRNAILYQQAVKNARLDALTGVGNRFAFSRSFEREYLLAQRHNYHLSLLVMDVDHFKRINDHYGHLVGDKVLKEVAQTLQTAMRQTDMIFRYGGEEFTAILTETDTEGARVIAERIRERIGNLVIQHDDQSIHVTISIGIGSLRDSNNDRELFEQADNNLYMAKRSGRNVVCG